MKINLKTMDTPPLKHHAVAALNSDAEFTWAGEEITWTDGNPTNITEEQIATKLVELTTEWEALNFARKRKEEYPSIEECVHAILDDDLENLQISRQAVKDKYEKP